MSQHQESEKKIINLIHSINDTCKQGKEFDRLMPHFHKDVVMVHPGFQAQAKGRDVCLKCYEDACSQMTIHKLEASEEKIDVFGNTAVSIHRYDCVWDYKNKKFEDDGHEILVFVKESDHWQVAWRTLIPGSRQTEACPTEQEPKNDPKGDVRQTCLNLMTSLPVCHLTSIDKDGFPHTTAMLNLRCAKEYPSIVGLYEEADNEFLVFMSTGMQTKKMARMEANPKVSVYFCDVDGIIGCMLGGEVEIVTDQDLKNQIWQKGWTMYYPNGPEGPEYGILKLEPTIVRGWCRNHPFEFKVKGTE